jgi:hypothetical protein
MINVTAKMYTGGQYGEREGYYTKSSGKQCVNDGDYWSIEVENLTRVA